MAGQFKPLFSMEFSGVSSVSVVHNLDRMQVGIIVRIGNVVRNDLISTITPAAGDSRNEVVVQLTSSQSGEILVSDTDYVFANIPSPEDAAAIAVGFTDTIACCPFGAKSDSLGKFLIANGKSTTADDSTKPRTRQPIGITGTLTGLVYQTADGSTSTQMKIHINGSVEATVVLGSMNADLGGAETISVSVSAGDYVEIEYDSSQKPGECTMYLIMEPS
ncbi:MAG: hypothetical protein HRU00_09875 [Myxococcales bacterium]|nr:hypothetical protein [Myxococcales bacterium]